MAEYIERQKLNQYLNETMSAQTTTAGMAYVKDLWDKVLSLPAADVAQVVHGRWNDINPTVLNPGVNWICRCSLCGCPQDYKHNYCPNCGALMREVGNGEK